MNLIVGLGNPGKKYEHTRHNLGFLFLDYLADKYKGSIKSKKFEGLHGTIEIDGKKIILLKPQTYMNLSGECVGPMMNFFKIEIPNLTLIYDDLDMEWAKIRFRESGRSGGHNGVKSIMETLATDQIKRIKIGIGRSAIEQKGASDHVLEKMSKDELKQLPEIFEQVEKLLLSKI